LICPNCGSNVPDDSRRCPACHADLTREVVSSRPQGTWCPRCGALVPDGEEACPSCGTPILDADAAAEPEGEGLTGVPPVPKGDDGVEGPSDAEETHAMPRIESAIPSEGEDDEVGRRDRFPRARVLTVALGAAVAMIVGLTLVITHPWNPDALDDRAKTDADTSMAGYPGYVSALQGQDNASADASQEDYNKYYLTGTADQRSQGKVTAEQLSYDISNLISSIDDVDVTSGTYADTADNLRTLGNWLRNRIDFLKAGWQKDASYDQPQDHEDELSSYSTSSGTTLGESYKQNFEDKYSDWEPKQAS
jgi:RNA polymerase subunit RPABC4/transcription elongation factor Spt4